MSLLPSATEILCGIPGGKRLLVARSSEDDYPSDIVHLPAVIDQITKFTTSADVDKQVKEKMKELGTLYVVDRDRIEVLKPDVILTQDLCRVCSIDLMTVERIAQTMDPQPQVLNLSPVCLEDMLDNVTEVGQAAGLEAEAQEYRKPRVAFMDWVDPIIVGGHWMPQMIEIAGGIALLNPAFTGDNGHRHGDRAIKVTPEELLEAKPDVLIIAACGLEMHTLRKEIGLISGRDSWKAIRAAVPRIVICDGHYYFNRPGPRLVDSLEFMAGYINKVPDLIPGGFEYEELQK
ncbi:helical backbone metal receptor [Linderina pennispora]|uniref:Helical backbone metal receptor n=1 Tax=Linderina pennispora TaxID=61395 RepID=A0A1Y1W3P2_9FUNG|nr:helical backbone metal receptor [Linderina pennispora]ORX67906.1 helical backbone metal receptor [Linderina pennispora]